MAIKIEGTADNSSYADLAVGYAFAPGPEAGFQSTSCDTIIDVTNTTNVKVRFQVVQANTGNRLEGNTDANETSMTFIRLGDT